MQARQSDKPARGDEETGSCLDDELLYQYLDGQLSKRRRRTVEAHLNSCVKCYEEIRALMLVAHAPVSAAEEAELAKMKVLSPEEQVAQIEEFVKKESEQAKVKKEYQKKPVLDIPGAGIWGKAKEFLEWLGQRPRYALAIPVALALIVVAFVVKDMFRPDGLGKYVYDDQVPYEYDVSGLRSASDELERDRLFRSFVSQFKLGMSNYLTRDYQNAIASFASQKSEAAELQARLPDENVAPWLRDYYFYQGVSHLALLRSKRLDLDQTVRARHAEGAIQSLQQADALARNNNLEGNDREKYFLGLAYGFAGLRDSAAVQLRMIKTGSSFYDDSVKLIQEWSK